MKGLREGNGTPLQYSCLENPRDGGAWQAKVHGVAKSWTRLSDFPFTFIKRLFSSSLSAARVNYGMWFMHRTGDREQDHVQEKEM